MEIVVIGSGSSGNSTYIKGSSATIMIDAGISLRQVKSRLKENGIEDVWYAFIHQRKELFIA